MKRILLSKSALIAFVLINSYHVFGQLSLTTSQSNVTCNGGNDGTATVFPANGTNHYSYVWSPSGGTNATATGLSAGTYTITVTDTVSTGGSQTTVYSEGFEGTHNWTLANSTGVNDVMANLWVVGAGEGGVAPGGCGIANNGNKTLHVTSQIDPTSGAAYLAGGICDIFPSFCAVTNKRAQSPAFSTVGSSNLTLEFDFISMGDGLIDNASVLYNSGSGWQVLSPSIKSNVCGGGQGEWAHFSMTLPASCNNNPSVQIGFNWTNNDDGIGTDPSVAINDVLVTSLGSGSPVYDIVSTQVTITEPAPLSSNMSVTSCGSYTLNSQTYNASGPYTQVVQNGNGCDSTINLMLTINPLPGNGISTTGPTALMSTTTGVTYSWLNCTTNQLVPNETSQTFVATANGTYAVITNNGTCSDTSTCMVINQVSINYVADLLQFSMYPNPTTEHITIQFDNVSVGNIEIINVDGKIVSRFEQVVSGSKLSFPFLESGMYILHLSTEKGDILHHFIKE